MERVNLFSAPHKALRKLMGNVSLMAGQVEAGNTEQIATLKLMGEELFLLLETHAASEEEFVLKTLEAKVPGASQANHQEHEELETKQTAVHAMMRRLNEHSSDEAWYRFYLAFTEYQSAYMIHILHEERDTNQVLWDHFTDEELVAIRMTLIQHLDFNDYLIWLKHMFAALSDTENAGMLSGMKIGMPAEPFKRVMDTLSASISESRFDRIQAKMSLITIN